jgi:hypothetical protein
LRYYFRNESYISTYAKYSPVLSSGKPLPFSNREVEIGIDYGIPIKDAHAITFSADYSSLQLVLDDGSQSDLRSYTLSLSYSL